MKRWVSGSVLRLCGLLLVTLAVGRRGGSCMMLLVRVSGEESSSSGLAPVNTRSCCDGNLCTTYQCQSRQMTAATRALLTRPTIKRFARVLWARSSRDAKTFGTGHICNTGCLVRAAAMAL
jgi:hypothetical protein